MKRANFIRYWRRSGLKNPDKPKIFTKKNVRNHSYHQFYPVLAKIRINRGLLHNCSAETVLLFQAWMLTENTLAVTIVLLILYWTWETVYVLTDNKAREAATYLEANTNVCRVDKRHERATAIQLHKEHKKPAMHSLHQNPRGIFDYHELLSIARKSKKFWTALTSGSTCFWAKSTVKQ